MCDYVDYKAWEEEQMMLEVFSFFIIQRKNQASRNKADGEEEEDRLYKLFVTLSESTSQGRTTREI